MQNQTTSILCSANSSLKHLTWFPEPPAVKPIISDSNSGLCLNHAVFAQPFPHHLDSSIIVNLELCFQIFEMNVEEWEKRKCMDNVSGSRYVLPWRRESLPPQQ